MNTARIGLLGYGEVGQRFAADLRAANAKLEIATFDLLLHQAAAGDALRRHAGAHGVELLADAAALGDATTLIFSAVTAEQTMIECAALVAAAGGRYVEAAVMTSVPPHGIRVPMLLGGTHASEARKMLGGLGFVTEVASTDLGVASAIKL